MKAIGLDIGTTTVCGVVIDGESGEVLFSKTVSNDSNIVDGNSFEKKQNPEKIWQIIQDIISQMEKEIGQVDSIGLTGQMHGILYVDKDGNAVSPLYTWQDESGNRLLPSGESYAALLSKKTGHFCASGFGLTTCYYQLQNQIVPKEAVYLTTVMDYVGMKLTGQNVPCISPSNAASLGLFDLRENCFDKVALAKAEIKEEMLPKVLTGPALIGVVKKGLPYEGTKISVSLGDNQASVFGTVRDIKNTVLVNVGTGSQISVGTDKFVSSPVVELRPFVDGDYIFAGSCLCGGRSYAMLEQFFEQVLHMAGVECTEKLYGKMGALLENVAEEKVEETSKLVVDPRFCGTRENPELRGSISGVGLQNFTPKHMIEGFLYGIAGEMYQLFEEIIPQLDKKPEKLVGSGNGVRMNPALQKAFEELFGMKLQIPVHTEEASYGTALFSLVAAGEYASLEKAQQVIKYN